MVVVMTLIAEPTTVPHVPAARDAAPRNRWALWGAAAGVAGFLGLFSDGSMSLSDEEYLLGQDLIGLLDRSPYHVGIVLGLAAALALLVTAAGWRRWAEEHAGRSLAARVVPQALTASAAAMFLGYGFKGSLAVYLDGGLDAGTMTDQGLYSVFMFLDFAPFISWWGVAMALGAIAWLGLRERLVGRGAAGVAAFFFAFPVIVVAAVALPGIPGVVCPLGLVVTSVLVARRSA
jgi:hypothetical protein